ncbi:MAG TPA: hypothetical protein VIK63_00370 [Haloplasmataceae bacterium]
MEKLWFLLLIIGLLFLIPVYASFIISGRLSQEEEQQARQFIKEQGKESPLE